MGLERPVEFLSVSSPASNPPLIIPFDNSGTDPAYSTWGGGSGVLVIYGIAKPAQTPVVGQVHALKSI